MNEDIEAEHNLISAVLFKPDMISILGITPSDFLEGPYDGLGLVFKAINELIYDKVDPKDPVMLYEQLVKMLNERSVNGESWFERIGGRHFLVDLVKNTKINFNNIEHYAKRVKEAASFRRFDQVADAVLMSTCVNEKENLLREAANATRENYSMPFAGLDIADLEKFSTAPVDWLVHPVFSCDQPTLIGGRAKGCKTTMLADLSVALASQTPWLGYFDVPKPRSVLFITGESNYKAMSRRIEKPLGVRGLTFKKLTGKLKLETECFPDLTSSRHRQDIERLVEANKIDVVIIDPLYRGLTGLDTNKLTEVGEAIIGFSKSCYPASLIISHHSTKTASRELGGPPKLEDMSGAGIAESFGNWWLLGRNVPYKADRIHDLCVSYGGRDEQVGEKRVLFDEGKWSFVVSDLAKHRKNIAKEKRDQETRKKNDVRESQIKDAEDEIKRALRTDKQPKSKASIQALCPQAGREQHRHAVANLIKNQSIIERPYIDSCNRQKRGWMLREHQEEFDKNLNGKGNSE